MNYPVHELNNYIFNLFIENIRYNFTHCGLDNYHEKRDHIYFIHNELSVSELKIICKKYGLKTTFNRAILCENIINLYSRLTKRFLDQDNEFLNEINQKNILIEIQEKDKLLRERISNVIYTLQSNMDNLSENDLQNYISGMGIHLHKLAFQIPSSMPIIENLYKNKYNIMFVPIDTPEDNLSLDCPICLESKLSSNFITTNCRHAFCCSCTSKYINTCNLDNIPKCSLCRTIITSYSFEFKKCLSPLLNILS
jgi:hypothetical protein